jgi:hypothetical protein
MGVGTGSVGKGEPVLGREGGGGMKAISSVGTRVGGRGPGPPG